MKTFKFKSLSANNKSVKIYPVSRVVSVSLIESKDSRTLTIVFENGVETLSNSKDIDAALKLIEGDVANKNAYAVIEKAVSDARAKSDAFAAKAEKEAKAKAAKAKKEAEAQEKKRADAIKKINENNAKRRAKAAEDAKPKPLKKGKKKVTKAEATTEKKVSKKKAKKVSRKKK